MLKNNCKAKIVSFYHYKKRLNEKNHNPFIINYKVFVLQLRTINESLKEKLCHDKHYASRITSTENALEQTKVLLSNLQLETSVLVKNIEKTKKTDEQDHQRDLMMLADRVYSGTYY